MFLCRIILCPLVLEHADVCHAGEDRSYRVIFVYNITVVKIFMKENVDGQLQMLMLIFRTYLLLSDCVNKNEIVRLI